MTEPKDVWTDARCALGVCEDVTEHDPKCPRAAQPSKEPPHDNNGLVIVQPSKISRPGHGDDPTGGWCSGIGAGRP